MTSRKSRGMGCHRPRLGRREGTADRQHGALRVVAPPAVAPAVDLGDQVGHRLACKRRIAGANALAGIAMADGAGLQPTGRIALVVKRRARRIARPGGGGGGRQAGIIGRYAGAIAGRQAPRHGVHHRVLPPPAGIVVELAVEIAGVAPGDARCVVAVAAAVEAVAGDAGMARAAVTAAQCDQLAGLAKGVGGRRRRGRASRREQHRAEDKGKPARGILHGHGTCPVPAGSPTIVPGGKRMTRMGEMIVLALCLSCLAACEPPSIEGHGLSGVDAERGRDVVAGLGCGACHDIPGIAWPRGSVGPPLDDFGDRALIAGRLPNRPDVLARFVADAPSLVPGTGMPPIEMTDEDARDAAAWLLTLRSR
jgi:hypothetical protein